MQTVNRAGDAHPCPILTKRSRSARFLIVIRTRAPAQLPILPVIKEYRKPHGDGPADGPCAPDSQRASGQIRERQSQNHPQHKVGQRACHKPAHGADAPQDSVRHQLGGDHEVEGREDPQKLHTRHKRPGGAFFHKQKEQIPAAEYVEGAEGNAQKPHHLKPGPEAFPDPSDFAGPQILGGKIGDPVSDGGKGGNDQIVQLHGGGIPGHHRRAEPVDHALDQDISHRDKALLQNAGNGDHQNFFEELPVEQDGGLPGLDLPQPFPYGKYGQDTAYSLTEKGGPGNTRYAHVKGLYKQNIHRDIGGGGGGQKAEGRSGIPQRRENPGGNIVKEDEGQAPHINIQIQPGVREHLLRRAHKTQQRGAPRNAGDHQKGAERGAEDTGGGHRGFQLPEIPGAKELGDDDGAAHIAAKGKSEEDQRNLVAVAHRRQRVFPHKFSRYQRVRYIVELLKDDAAKQGQTKPPQRRFGLSRCKICVHNILTSKSSLKFIHGNHIAVYMFAVYMFPRQYYNTL